MIQAEIAAALAITRAKQRGAEEVSPDDLLFGCLRAASQFGVVHLGATTIDLETLGVDWLIPAGPGGKVSYSERTVELLDRAARISRAESASKVGIGHLLAAFAGENDGLMGELKRRYGFTNAGWRSALADLSTQDEARPEVEERVAESRESTTRDYLSPEQAAEALGVHVQTLRAYVRSGKLPALRLAGERAIRIRRTDLEKLLEPLLPEAGG